MKHFTSAWSVGILETNVGTKLNKNYDKVKHKDNIGNIFSFQKTGRRILSCCRQWM